MRRRKSIMLYHASHCGMGNGNLVWPSTFLFVILVFLCCDIHAIAAEGCPPTEAILPCRCSLRGKEIQIWCSHSNLPQIMDGIKAVERNIKAPIDELVLENNQLPALPGRFFGTLPIVRLMLRHNSIERVSNGWLNELENTLVEVYIVEPQLRSIPVESLNGMINMIAITIQSDELKHLPDFSGLLSLTYLNVQSASLTELQPHWFRHLPKLQNIHITGGVQLNRLEAGLFDGLISLKNIDLSRNSINWIHLRALSRLPNLVSLKLSHNQIGDVRMVGRIVKDLENLKKLRLDHNNFNVVEEGAFVDLPHLSELHLNDNRITELKYGAFLRTPMLKTLYLHNNRLRRIHPESFMQRSGSGVETVYIYNNEIDDVSELRALLDALPALRFLDLSSNYITQLPYGALRGHGTLEQLHLNNNLLRTLDRDALMAMPALRELRMRNNSLSNELPMPFWNLPGLKGLDLSQNSFRVVDSFLLAGLPSLRRLDLSDNALTQLDPTTFIHNPMLETLNISSNSLVKLHPATFRTLDRLFELDVSYNQLREMVPGLPKIVERVSVRANSITVLPASSTLQLSLPNLRMLDLSQNLLEQLPQYGFQATPQLRVLSVAQNHLRSLEDITFIGAHRLELLHLQENALIRVDERAFLSLPQLRNLNLQGNQLEAITDNMFANNTRLEQLDLSRNSIRTIAPAAFEAQRALEYLDLSGNALGDISIGLSNLANLRDIDLSYNQIARVHADIVSAWRNVVEIRLSNNLIVSLHQGTFRNLPRLQYLDLSSNEINSVEPGALKNLPDLQEFVLADNKMVELKDHVFEDLPNLLASHFQYNTLRYISPESFFSAPSMVFLNLSNNNFRNMENIGLRSMRNLEVLDLSSNDVKSVSTMPLKALNWLVELKMDNNKICKIQGTPFETMPRLRVLSMRNNRLRIIQERTFRNLRGNIAILDVDGNPINCSCEMQWLSVWLQETNFPYPGPKCQDGRLLRSSRIEKSRCEEYGDVNQRATGNLQATAEESSNHLPLLNEHGDIFQRQLHAEDLNDECEGYEDQHGLSPPLERPLAGESEYFYDQYIDYPPPSNENISSFSQNIPLSTSTTHLDSVASTMLSHEHKPVVSANIDMNNTILNTKYFNKRPAIGSSLSSSSPFTFFGYPLTGLSIGRFFGAGQRGRKDRGENRASSTAATVSSTTRRPPQAMDRGGKVRMYQPNSAEFEKYLSQEPTTNFHDATARSQHVTSASDESGSNEASSIFRTAFRVPSSVERGGFRPILPEHVGGFMPVHDPHYRRGHVQSVTTTTAHTTESERLLVPVATEISPKRHVSQHILQNIPQSNSDLLPTAASSEEEFGTQTYYVTESPIDVTTPARRITPPHYTTRSDYRTERTTRVSTRHDYTTEKLSTSSTNVFTSPMTTTTTAIPMIDHIDSEFYDDEDLETQSVDMFKPLTNAEETSTAETILLIPPPEEHVEQFKRHSWVTATTTTALNAPATTVPSITMTSTSASTQLFAKQPTDVRSTGSAGGHATITKVFTPPTLNQYLPTAEEYYRTTTSSSIGPTSADAQKRKFQVSEEDQIGVHSSAGYRVQQESAQTQRKDGMDWYYDSFKKQASADSKDESRAWNQRIPTGSSLQSGEFPRRIGASTAVTMHTMSNNCLGMLMLFVLLSF